MSYADLPVIQADYRCFCLKCLTSVTFFGRSVQHGGTITSHPGPYKVMLKQDNTQYRGANGIFFTQPTKTLIECINVLFGHRIKQKKKNVHYRFINSIKTYLLPNEGLNLWFCMQK